MSDRDAVWAKAESFRTCMLVTRAQGSLRARPMTPLIDRASGEIRFLTSRLGFQDDEIAADPDVCLTFAHEGDEFLSLSGKAEVSRDHALIVSLWGPHAEPYFERGLEDANIMVITVRPERAEIWQGAKTVTTLFGTAGQPPVATSVDLAEPAQQEALNSAEMPHA